VRKTASYNRQIELFSFKAVRFHHNCQNYQCLGSLWRDNIALPIAVGITDCLKNSEPLGQSLKAEGALKHFGGENFKTKRASG
jgi:hypothetical protein